MKAKKRSEDDYISQREMDMLSLAYKNSLIEQTANTVMSEDIEEVRTVYPTEEEFKDPIAYIEKMYQDKEMAAHGGLRIVPPQSFKPDVCFRPSEEKKDWVPTRY